MEIKRMNSWEKSSLLTKLLGLPGPGLDLYDENNISTAWMMLNFVYDMIATTDDERVDPEDWFFEIDKTMSGTWSRPLAEFIARPLDRIIELAHDAGMLEDVEGKEAMSE